MPPGVPVATVSIGKPGATNAGVLAAQILGVATARREMRTRNRGDTRRLAHKVERWRCQKIAGRASAKPGPEYSIVTFGCRVNQADSLRHRGRLRAAGASSRPRGDADLVVVNTCSVTATADQGARQTIRRVARENPSAKIVVTGCYATRCAR